MKYHSTVNFQKKYSLTQALIMGLAEDGGLFVPETLPQINLDNLTNKSYLEIAVATLSPFFQGDELEKKLPNICAAAFNFPLVVKELNSHLTVAELFHGPTQAFKDFGARFLAECLTSLDQNFTILVATSGDTGGAVASAFFKKPKIKVGILFPQEGVSPEQFQQLTSWGENIVSLAVDGTFDDCQKLVKEVFKDHSLPNLTSANSINIGRVLAQMTYYAYLSLQGHKNFVIPSGNIGNSLGAFWAKEMGFPIEKIIIATNANQAITHFQQTKQIKAFPTIKTLANAMDVGLPSNLERLALLNPDFEVLQVQDLEILQTIKTIFARYHYLIDPHTAVAMTYGLRHPQENLTIISTAHPYKFATVLQKYLPQVIQRLPNNPSSGNWYYKIPPLLTEIYRILK